MIGKKTRHIAIVFMLLASLPLFSCARTIVYHEYESMEEIMDGFGKIRVSVSGSYVDNGKKFFGKMTTYGNPYFLSISFEPFSSKQICLSKVTSSQNGQSKDIHSGKLVCDTKDHGKIYPHGYQVYGFEGIYLNVEIPVRFDVEYVIPDSKLSNQISVNLVNKPVRRERRNDFLDMIGSG
uniref:Lipoprotein n=1 Tax=Candidatus Kentrum sp. MB TaxID=2138164 RepID=A0A450X4K1_9GAMM|nr:MAG: hypothetical protein BECKMB1821G_GA0114241_100740 [Candidatus Kentron sp. MB]VFK30533.1 MAG: hypothetical protein BECKMB1821I_GA0114274_101622 [Candidatus Kentron sp. MB]VFK75289.1 MAG: hypothetical protein BECKMB1821H_GA0114242_101921 [Candidatus Kentron sp. MB]